MASYAESNASFKHRALQIQLSEDHVQSMYDNDIRCFNHLAFAVNGQPGQLDQERFQNLIDMICPRGASIGVQAGLKQLAYESLTVAVAAIKQRIETPDDVTRKLPAQEKDQRLKVMREKITGFEIKGDYEPAHCVIDAFASMLDEGALRHFPLSRCVSRELELLSIKTDKQVVLLEGQQLQVKAKSSELTSELGNELRVHQAMIRRGLALEMSNLGTYAAHEKVMREFMSHLNRQAPPGYRAASIDAILRADRELWTRVADRVRSDLRANKDGELPVDKALEELHTSPSVAFHLLPLPGSTTSNNPNNANKRKTVEEDAPKPKAQPKAQPKRTTKNRQGFQVFSVDHKAVKGIPILMIDLNSVSQRKIFDELLAQRRLIYVHFAPPCGAASLARCIKLKGRSGPRPLRSMRYPMGLPSLPFVSRERVSKANRLYSLTWFYINKLARECIGWSVENPASSLMWVTDPFLELMAQYGDSIFGVSFHTCMFGSNRKKQTALWTSVQELQQLHRVCDDSHSHAPWGVTKDGSFATAEECAYDPQLCAHWAEAIAQYAIRLGYAPPPATLQDVAADHLQVKDMANRAFLGAMPRGNKLPPLLTDFLRTTTVSVSAFPFLQHAKPGARLPDNQFFPKGARLLRVFNDQQGVSEADIGLPVEPVDYIKQACTLVHPNMQPVKLPEGMEWAIQLQAEGHSLDLRRVRISWTKSMMQMLEEGREAERTAAQSRPDHLRSVLEGKRFELMRCALDAVGYPDSCIAAEASAGLPLVGWMKQSGMFGSNLRPPELHVDSLESMAASFSGRSIASTKASSDVEMDREVWKATLAEVDGGTLDGPYDLNCLPSGHVVSPRFGIRQGQKVRPIDNLTASGINATVGLPERLQVDTVDEVAAMIKRCMQVHGPGCKLLGRTYDLRKAYRQLGVSADHYKFSWISVWSPEHECVKLFRMKGLPFGGTASVAAFLRVSRALKELGIRGGALMWSSFFDDFICITRPEDAGSADMTIRFLFKSLGWVLSEDPEKDKGFSSVFTALGVEFDLTGVSSGVLRIGNTQRRREELSTLIEGFLASDRLTCGESESLRSRLAFAEGQIFGRSAKMALRAVGSPVRTGRDCSPLSEEVRFGLQWMLDRVVNAPPRVIRTADEPHFLLFLDGACEPGTEGDQTLVTSVGAVLLDARGAGVRFFGLRIPDDITGVWAGNGRQQLVFEAEVLPYLLALTCWSDILGGRHLLAFIDNDGARHSWVKGGAESIHALRMIHRGTLLEAHLEVSPYFCRVPTRSNLADGPSCLDFALCRALGAIETKVPHETLPKCALGVEQVEM
eukprot:s2670_g9.t1